MKKTISKIIFFLSLVGLLAACQIGTITPTQSAFTPDIASIKTSTVKTASAELALTAAPTPSSTPIPPTPPTPSLIVFSPGEAPSFIIANGSLPIAPGNYLLYEDSNQYAALDYISMDGTLQGSLFSFVNDTNRYHDWTVTSSAESPRLVFVDREDSEINIWVTDLKGNPLKSLHGKTNFDARNECYDEPWVLSNSHWLVLSCGPENKRLTYFVDLSSSNEKITSLGLNYCAAGYDDVKSSFPYDEAEWILWCNKPQDFCFISRFGNKKVCIDLSNVLKSSPADLSEVVFVEGNMPHNSDETVPGIRIVVFDRACLLKESPCGPSQEFELPYYQPITAEKLAAPSLELQWGKDGKSLAWLLAPFGAFGRLNTRGIGPANSGVIDLTMNTSQVLWQGIPPEDTHLAGWSPDGNWLLFHDKKGLYIGSIKQQNIRRLVTTEYYGEAAFYGWLTIP